MAKIVRRLGSLQGNYCLADIRLEHGGYLPKFSLLIPGNKYRHVFIDREQDAVFVLPVNWDRRVLYLVKQARPVKALSNVVGRTMLRHCKQAPEHRVTFDGILAREVHTIDAPAGMIDGLETPEMAGVREVEEETGFVIEESSLEKLSNHFTSTGCNTERHICFLASVTDATPMHDPEGDGTENIETLEVSFEEAFDMLAKFESEHASLNFLLAVIRGRDELIAERMRRTAAEADAKRSLARALRAEEALKAFEEQRVP